MTMKKHTVLFRLSITALTFCVLLLSLSCSDHKSKPAQANNETTEAHGLEIYRDGDCWVAKVKSPSDSTQNLGVYIFPDKENSSNLPSIPGAIIFPPSKRGKIMAYTSVYTSAIKELGAQDIIKIVGDTPYFTDPFIVNGLKNGTILDGGMQQEPVTERIMTAKPDMIILSHYDGFETGALAKLNVPIIYMRESSETDPLGRAEWIKLLGLITGKKAKADSIYSIAKTRYTDLANKAKAVKNKPSVMAETMYQGTWAISGGNSYAARLIEDAGGKYLWADDNSTGSLQLSFETVLGKASNADIWLIRTFGKDMTLSQLKSMDSRYMLFKPTRKGGVWNANTAKVPLYDETPFHPDLLLKEYITIFHPALLPDSELKYFSRVD